MNTLGLGKVVKDKSRAMCYYKVSRLDDIREIIKIFDSYSLNSTKILNFLKFKEAFELYTSLKVKTPELVIKLEELKSEMNSKRTDFKLPEWHKLLIDY